MSHKRRENSRNIGWQPYGRIVEGFYRGLRSSKNFTRAHIRKVLDGLIKQWLAENEPNF